MWTSMGEGAGGIKADTCRHGASEEAKKQLRTSLQPSNKSNFDNYLVRFHWIQNIEHFVMEWNFLLQKFTCWILKALYLHSHTETRWTRFILALSKPVIRTEIAGASLCSAGTAISAPLPRSPAAAQPQLACSQPSAFPDHFGRCDVIARAGQFPLQLLMSFETGLWRIIWGGLRQEKTVTC